MKKTRKAKTRQDGSTFWQTLGDYEYEVERGRGYTGWCRCVGGRLANGTWPIFGGK